MPAGYSSARLGHNAAKPYRYRKPYAQNRHASPPRRFDSPDGRGLGLRERLGSGGQARHAAAAGNRRVVLPAPGSPDAGAAEPLPARARGARLHLEAGFEHAASARYVRQLEGRGGAHAPRTPLLRPAVDRQDRGRPAFERAALDAQRPPHRAPQHNGRRLRHPVAVRCRRVRSHERGRRPGGGWAARARAWHLVRRTLGARGSAFFAARAGKYFGRLEQPGGGRGGD